MPLTTDEKLASLELEIDLLRKRLENELLAEARALVSQKEHKAKKIFKPSRITAYKLQLVTNKYEKLQRVAARFAEKDVIITSYSKLMQKDTKNQQAKELEIKHLLVKNLHTNIVERVIAGDVVKAQEMLTIKNKLEKELIKKGYKR